MSRISPQDPFLFCSEWPTWHSEWGVRGGTRRSSGWRWISFEAAGTRVRQWQEWLRGAPPGAIAEIVGSPSVETLIADLAVRSLGLFSFPQPVPGVGAGDGDDRPLEAGRVSLPVDVDLRGISRLGSFEANGVGDGNLPGQARIENLAVESGSHEEGPDVGGCMVVAPDGSDRRLARDSVERAARGLEAIMGTARERSVAIHARSLYRPSERLVVEWALRTAAALIVLPGSPPTSEAIGRAAFELRPTVLHGSAKELAAWAVSFRAAEGRSRGVRRRFNRLEWVIVTGRSALDSRVEAFYAGLGAAVLVLAETRLLDFDRL